jgi:hypothetical protein
VDAYARAAFFRENLGWKNVARLLRAHWKRREHAHKGLVDDDEDGDGDGDGDGGTRRKAEAPEELVGEDEEHEEQTDRWARQQYRSYVFNRYVSNSMSTLTNMVQMLGGVPDRAFLNDEGGRTVYGYPQRIPGAGPTQPLPPAPRWLWSTAHRNGYRSLLEEGDMASHYDSRTFGTFTAHHFDEWNVEDGYDSKPAFAGEDRNMQVRATLYNSQCSDSYLH